MSGPAYPSTLRYSWARSSRTCIPPLEKRPAVRRRREILELVGCLLFILAWFYFAFVAEPLPDRKRDRQLTDHLARHRAAHAEIIAEERAGSAGER